jgi:hypothetical protein
VSANALSRAKRAALRLNGISGIPTMSKSGGRTQIEFLGGA